MAQTNYTPIQLYHSTTGGAAPTPGKLGNGELAINITDGKLFYKDNLGAVQVLATKAGINGDVVGPASSTDNALVRFDATSGKLVQNSVGLLSDTGDLTGLKSISVGTGYSPNIALSDAATIAWDTTAGQVATFTFVSSNRTVGAPSSLVSGAFYALAVIQNAGSNTLTWNSVFKWANGAAPTLSTAASAKDYFVFRSDGTNLYEQGRSQGVA